MKSNVFHPTIVKKKPFIVGIISLALLTTIANINFSWMKSFISNPFESKIHLESEAYKQIGTSISKNSELPNEIDIDGKKINIDYSIDPDFNNYVKKLLKRYKSDYSAVVVIDNNTGQILSAMDYDKEKNTFGMRLPFTSSHPAASIFKIVTAAELLENTETFPNSQFFFKGRQTTLYKNQLSGDSRAAPRLQSFSKAFALSNNVIFGKAAIERVKANSIFDMASKFGFNNKLMNKKVLSPSETVMPESQYHLAEIASGFNKETKISPVHGAVMASIIANNGILKYPKLLKKAKLYEDDKVQDEYYNYSISKRVLSEEVANNLQDMMELTVARGTARRSFRGLSRKIHKEIDIGGKTGTITGGLPYGKRDWFVAYAVPKTTKKNGKVDKGISLCVMNINVKKWYFKSSFLARKIIKYYYDKVM